MAKAFCQGLLIILRARIVQSPEPQQGRAAAEAKWSQMCGLKVCVGREPASQPWALPMRAGDSQRKGARSQKCSREKGFWCSLPSLWIWAEAQPLQLFLTCLLFSRRCSDFISDAMMKYPNKKQPRGVYDSRLPCISVGT